MSTSLGENVSKDSSKWGNAKVCKIMNDSGNRITFKNPYYSKEGNIEAGKQESSNTTGYIPLSSTGVVYEVTYYNTNLGTWNHVGITDQNSEWMLSFKQAGVVDEIEVQPVGGGEAQITLIFNDGGYKFQSCDYEHPLSSLQLRNIPKH